MPNMGPWINQPSDINKEFTTSSKFEKQLMSIKDERQQMIRPSCHPTSNERHEKIIEMIDGTLEKYKVANIEKTQHNEQVIIERNLIKKEIKLYTKRNKLY